MARLGQLIKSENKASSHERATPLHTDNIQERKNDAYQEILKVIRTQNPSHYSAALANRLRTAVPTDQLIPFMLDRTINRDDGHKSTYETIIGTVARVLAEDNNMPIEDFLKAVLKALNAKT